MTIQLELNFLPAYAFSASAELRAFAVSASALTYSFKDQYFSHYKALQRQASDLKNYAFLHDFINDEEYAVLSNSILESSDLFWS